MENTKKLNKIIFLSKYLPNPISEAQVSNWFQNQYPVMGSVVFAL